MRETADNCAGSTGSVVWRGGEDRVGEPWAWQDKEVLTVVVIEEDNTREQAAERLGCSVETLDKYVRRFELNDHPDAFTGR